MNVVDDEGGDDDRNGFARSKEFLFRDDDDEDEDEDRVAENDWLHARNGLWINVLNSVEWIDENPKPIWSLSVDTDD